MDLRRSCALAALLLAGCTPMHWVKSDVTPERAREDAIACRQDAWREARSRAWPYQTFGPVPFFDSRGRLAYASPYSRYGDPFGDPYFEESRLQQFCMRAKGYELVPAETIQPSPAKAESGKP
jgi:hypothetical protein